MCSKYVRVIDQPAANEMPLPSAARRFHSTSSLQVRSVLEQAVTPSICSTDRHRSDRPVCRRRSGRGNLTFCMTSLHFFTHISTSNDPAGCDKTHTSSNQTRSVSDHAPSTETPTWVEIPGEIYCSPIHRPALQGYLYRNIRRSSIQ